MTTQVAPRSERPLLGMTILAITVLFFAISDVLTKTLTMSHPIVIVVAVRNWSALVLMFLVLFPRLGRRLWYAHRLGLLVARGALLAVGSGLMAMALRLMPVAETISIVYLSPLAVMAISVVLYKEKISTVGWILAAIGFAGILVIVRPGAGLDPLGVLFVALNTITVIIFQLMTGKLSRTESSYAMLFHLTLAGAILYGVIAVPQLAQANMNWHDLGLMIMLGVSSTAGHFGFSLAYREASPSLIGPVNYMHIVWAAILGWLIFDHIPSPITLLGIGMVVGSGVLIAVRTHFTREKA